LITRIKFGEEHKLQSSSLCSPLHSPVTSSLLEAQSTHGWNRATCWKVLTKNDTMQKSSVGLCVTLIAHLGQKRLQTHK
jgi:hypothetical protein